ncbi:MAG: hypothetical protein ACJ8ER_13850 [Allosphingosinicella sp.]
MSDYDRDRETVRETDRTTTVVQTDGGRGGGAGIILAVLLILVLLGVLWFLFGGGFNRAADKVGVNVAVEGTKVAVPDVNLKIPDKIEVDTPNIDVKTDGNKSK